MTTKNEIIDKFIELLDRLDSLHKNELKELKEQGKITYGAYWYVLNPNQNYGTRKMFGFDKQRAMILNKQNYKVRDFNYMLNSLKELEQEILRAMAQVA